jgi:hypothetical protein
MFIFTLFRTPSWPMPLQALALVVNPRLGLQHACRCVLEIKGCLGGFWYPFSMFRLRAFFFVSIVSPPCKFLKSIHYFLFILDESF